MKKIFFLTFIIPFFLLACEEEEEILQIKVVADFPSEMTMGQTDTLKFWVNSFRYINTVQLKEVIEVTDTVTYASFGRSILSDTTLSFRVNYLYSPKNTGNKNMLLFIRSADIYTRFYPFEIFVKDSD